MLRGIDPLLTPELLFELARMGHGDLIAVVDRNYPAHSNGRRVVEIPGASTTEVMAAIAAITPIDGFQRPAVWYMETAEALPGPAVDPARSVLATATGGEDVTGGLERFAFYERARTAWCTVRTGDDRPYACFLIAKGVL